MKSPTEQHRFEVLARQREGRTRLLAELRRAGVHDARVLAAMAEVPRECFVTPGQEARAYEDLALPIACAQTISQPMVVGWMTAALDLHPGSRVLEIGTGSGYQTAVLARLAGTVFSVERHPALARLARARLDALGVTNVHTRTGDGTLGWPEAAPFERILVTAAPAAVPPALLAQLARGGVMVVPVGAPEATQELLRLERDDRGEVHTRHLMDVRFVPLVGD